MQFILESELLEMEKATRLGDVKKVAAILNEVFTRCYNKAIEDSIKVTPKLTMALLMSEQGRNKIKDDFNKKNPDFMNHRDIVLETIQEVESQNPQKDYEFILALAEPMIRKRIDLKESLNKVHMDKPDPNKLNWTLGNGRRGNDI